MTPVEQTVTQTAASVTEHIADKVLDKASDFVTAAAASATNMFDAASNIITTAAAKYGPIVVDAVLWTVRIDAIQTLVRGWVYLVGSIICLAFIWTGFTRRDWHSRIHRVDAEPLYVLIIIVGVVSSGFFIAGLRDVTNIWLYTAVAKPELYIAKQAIDIVKHKLDSPKHQQ